MFEPMYYDLMITWVAGYIGGIWWFGMEIDVPKPGDPSPWMRLVPGVVGGILAVIFSRLATGHTDAIVDLAVAVVVGRFGGSIVNAALPRRAV